MSEREQNGMELDKIDGLAAIVLVTMSLAGAAWVIPVIVWCYA